MRIYRPPLPAAAVRAAVEFLEKTTTEWYRTRPLSTLIFVHSQMQNQNDVVSDLFHSCDASASM